VISDREGEDLPRERADAAPSAAGRAGLLALLGRHQIASIVTTAVDFLTMTLAVELLRLSPVAGTVAGATVGAVTNFQLGRHWIYEARAHDTAATQGARYVIVSGASCALNALGEYVLCNLLGLYYLAARVIVAVTVSLCWNFPMHRYFVFKRRA
jgi:putative flippase GtrA